MGHENGQSGGNTDNGQVQRIGSMVRRTVSVKGSGGVTATVVVTTRRGQVWLSIQPPFTWEAIMGPGKVEELVRTLGRANEDTKKMVDGAGAASAAGEGTPPVGNGAMVHGNEAVGIQKENRDGQRSRFGE